MKKLFAAILALALFFCAALAEGNWYIEEGQALALRMQTLAGDEAYFSLISSGNKDLDELRGEFVGTDLSAPSAAWFLPLPDDEKLFSAIAMLAVMDGSEETINAFNGISDAGREELIRRLPASAGSILASRAGVRWIALSGLINVGAAREEPDGFTPGYLLLEYPGDFAVLVLFSQSVPGYVGISTYLVPAGSLEEIRPVLDYAKLLGLTLELEELEIN